MNLMPNLECANSGRAMICLMRCSSVALHCARPSTVQQAIKIAVTLITIIRMAFILVMQAPRENCSSVYGHFQDVSELEIDFDQEFPCGESCSNVRYKIGYFFQSE